MVCPIRGNSLDLWAKGRWSLVLCFGAGAPDDGWRVWRCPTCGFVAVHRRVFRR